MTDNLCLNGQFNGAVHGSSHSNNGCGHDNHLYHEIASNANQLSLAEQLREVEKSVQLTGAANSVAIEKIGAASQLTTEKTAAAIAVQVEKVGAANQLATMLGFKDALIQSCKDTADIRKDIADCCCETQKIVLAEANKTRELILSLDASNKAVALVDAKNEILALRAAGNGNGNNVR